MTTPPSTRRAAASLACALPIVRAALGLALAWTLAGCFDHSPEKLMASARDYLAKNDAPAAVIQLRNVLQKSPQNGEARLLLGATLLGQGDALAAEKELRRALEFGQPAGAVLPALARALIELGQAEALVKEFGSTRLDDPTAAADFGTSLAEARLRLGQIAEARSGFDAALAQRPGYPPARLGQALLALYDGQREQALAIADEVIAADPRLARAHALRADLLLARGDAAGARQSLERALEADPRYTVARLALVSQLMEEKAYDQAAAQIATGLKASRGDARLVLLDATLSMRKGDRAAARDKVQQVLKVAPEYVPSLLLAGQIELADNNVASAQQHLRKALNRAPDNEAVRRTLAAAYLRGNQPVRARETLQPLLASEKTADPGLMMLAGEAFLAGGDLKQASAYFSKASTGEAQKAAAQTRLGQIALASGNADAGLKQLESAAEIEGSGVQADLALIAAHLRRNELDKAQAAARALEKKQPNNPLSHHMLGMVAASRKDLKAAREHFGRAIELAPDYLPSLGALASLDLADKRPAEARKRFEDLIARDPKNEAGYLALADIQSRTGATPKEVGATLERAIAANPQAVQARVAQVNLLLAERDAKAALTAAQNAANAIPDEGRVLEALARAQDAAGDYNQAAETLQKLATLQPESAQPQQQLAALHLRNRQPERALDALRRAQRLAPDNLQILAAMAAAQLAAGRPDDALKEARALQAKSPKIAAAYALEAEIHAARKDWPQAERAVREALKLEPADATIAVKLNAILVASGRASEAAAQGRRWLADHPRDLVMRMHLADRALREQDYKTAFGLYQQVIEIAPNNPIALNNLAWVAGELGDARALGYAERALKLAPNSANVLDTMGALLVKQGDAKQGLAYIERARAIDPKRAEFQLSHARALIALGRKDEARRELEALAQRNEPFTGRESVPGLLKSL
jgi:putative PEP-CTERM system TPR-repeat lipoprotein